MRIVVIGGTGHIGTFLVPRLVQAGHDVINLSRGGRQPYADAAEWQHVQQIVADRQQEDAAGTLGGTVLAHHPDVVVDLVCFTLESARALVDALRGRVGHLLHCGSVWRYGPSHKLPIAEGTGTAPFDEYGIQKARIAQLLGPFPSSSRPWCTLACPTITWPSPAHSQRWSRPARTPWGHAFLATPAGLRRR
jgi:nucleoside-diphosphate-sugar epimerase